jgi:peptide deformylase
MSIISLVQITPDALVDKKPPLRVPSEEVIDFGESFQRIVDDLIETFTAHKIAIGLAAPQIGIQLRLTVINISKDKKDPHIVVVNPTVLSTGGKKDKKKESCMSLPHYAGEVERRDKMRVSYQDRFGEKKQVDVNGFLARVFAHEIDHLDGLLYPDRMKDVSKLEKTDIFKYD